MEEFKEQKQTTKIMYILYLVNIFFGITSIIGLIMAYVYRNDSPRWLQTHHQYLIRTFWIGLLYTVIGLILTVILIGLFIILATIAWFIIRCVIGLKYLDENKPHPNPKTWMF